MINPRMLCLRIKRLLSKKYRKCKDRYHKKKASRIPDYTNPPNPSLIRFLIKISKPRGSTLIRKISRFLLQAGLPLYKLFPY